MPLILIMTLSVLYYTNLPKHLRFTNLRIDSGYGDSMKPTFREGDKVVVDYSEIKPEDIKRGDIVSFVHKSPLVYDTTKLLQKRIVGMPGEMVEIKKGQVYIEGKKLQENYTYFDSLISFHLDDKSKYIYSEFYSTIRSEDSVLLIQDSATVLSIDNCFYPISNPPVILDSSYYYFYYVLGDNRFHSTDSRSYGPIPIDIIKGKAKYIYKPYWRSLNL
jgi:signal peptidase I